MRTKSRVYDSLLSLLQSREKLTAPIAAEKVYCDIRSARVMLTRLHSEKKIRICEWINRQGGAAPVYCISDGKRDSPKPPTNTSQQALLKAKRRKESAELREKEAVAKRIKRDTERALSGVVRLGIWGL